MAFDDRKTEPLIAIAGLSIVCGLAVPVVNRLTDGWWGLLLLASPVAIWVGLAWLWRREDRQG